MSGRNIRPLIFCPFRAFPRVGQGVGQSHRRRRCGSTFSGSGMVTFCAAGNNERVSKRRHRAAGRSAMLPPGGSAGFRYGSKCGSKRFQRIKKRRQNIFLKGKSNLMIFDRYADLKYKYRPRNFGCRRYYVDTVGRNKNHSGVYPKPTGGGLCR